MQNIQGAIIQEDMEIMQLETENLQLKQQIRQLKDHFTSKPLDDMGALHFEMLTIKEKQAEIIQQQQR